MAATVALLLVGGPVRGSATRPKPRSGAESRSSRRLEALHKRHRQLKQDFAKDLEATAKYCDGKGLAKEAAALRRLAKNVVTKTIHVHRLSPDVQPDLPRDLPAAQREWRLRFRKARVDYANALYQLARDVLYAPGVGSAGYAYKLVREVATYDSDHVAARRLLGYVRYRNKWVTPFEKRKAEHGEVWHDKYGWLPREHVKQYQNGLEFYVSAGGKNGRWKRADVVAQLRRNFNNAWVVRTEHYLVKTNHSLQEGVRVAKKLEDYYRDFFQTFAGFFTGRQQLKKLFAGADARHPANRRPYVVHYYRTKDEYVQKLRRVIPQIAITNGLYLTTDRIAYFYHDPRADNTSTLYHEATHQIFYESLSQQRMIAPHEHFWIVEGISCYMESYRSQGGRVSLGNPNSPRFVAAKVRYVNDGFYIPLARFAAMGMRQFQDSKDIRKKYSQASGLAKFFMEYDGGKYRDALIEHISQIYRGSRRVQSLEELTGVPYKELDEQYRNFITALPVRVKGARIEK